MREGGQKWDLIGKLCGNKEPSEIEEIVIPFFKSIFPFVNPDGQSIVVVLAVESNNLTNDMNGLSNLQEE